MKTALKILGVLVLLLAGTAAYLYFNPKQAQNLVLPEVTQVEGAHVKLAHDTAFIDLAVQCTNKGIFRIHIDSLYYQLRFDTALLLTDTTAVRIVMPPGAVDTFHLPVSLPFKRLIASIQAAQEWDSVPIVSDVRIVYNTVFGHAAVPHKATSTIAVPRPPKFELERVEFEGFKHGKVHLLAHVAMHNFGHLALDVSNLRYNVKVADLASAEGGYSEKISVRPKSVIRRALPIEISLHHAAKLFGKIITDNDIVPYHITLKGDVEASKLGDKPVEVEIEKGGKFELHK